MTTDAITCAGSRDIPADTSLRRVDLLLPGLDQAAARKAAERAATEAAGEVMLLAWHDGKAGVGYPDVPECTGKPSWYAYGTGHGANLMVTVNEGEWTFLFLPLEK